MRLMVLGNARHGKDSVCEILQRDHGLTFESSSKFVAEKAVTPWLAAKGITYPSFEAMYADRVNHRPDWHDAIAAYNDPDPTRLGRELYDVYDVYCGIRSAREFEALKKAGVVQFAIWVDASERLPPEPATSISVTEDHADYIIDNNGPIKDLGIYVAHAVASARFAIDQAA